MKYNRGLIIIAYLLTSGCMTIGEEPQPPQIPIPQKPDKPQEKPQDKPQKPKKEVYLVVHSKILKEKFPDGTKVESQSVLKSNGKMYLFREGHTKKKNCRLTRTEVEKFRGAYIMRLAGVTETCSGKSCEHCEFKKGGGCNCKNIGQGVCAHTISRNTLHFRWLY
jgi:hypothetical protein